MLNCGLPRGLVSPSCLVFSALITDRQVTPVLHVACIHLLSPIALHPQVGFFPSTSCLVHPQAGFFPSTILHHHQSVCSTVCIDFSVTQSSCHVVNLSRSRESSDSQLLCLIIYFCCLTVSVTHAICLIVVCFSYHAASAVQLMCLIVKRVVITEW